MYWLIGIAVFILLLVCLFLFSVIVIEMDTRVPAAAIRFGGIAKAKIWYDDEWWLDIQVLFYYKHIRMSGIKKKPALAKAKRIKKKSNKKMQKRMLRKIIPLLKTFRVKECTWALDTGDPVWNAQLSLVNFLPFTRRHIFVNFQGQNYFVLKVRNYPWRILYTYFK